MKADAAKQPRSPRRTALYESRREREFYRYYEPIRALTEAGPARCDLYDPSWAQAHKPFSSPDRALTAFCQLGALRLGVRRAMLFFFDSKYAYVMAEATRTLSLQNDEVHDIQDDLWLGHSVIPRGFSICEETVCRLPSADDIAAGESGYSLIHIINDLEKDTQFCDRPYVIDGPKARFYAGVPITTPKGINIGAYCCLDDKKHDEFDEKSAAFLKDMASTVMAHLDMVRAKAEQERGTRMVLGLSAFVEGGSSIIDRTDSEDEIDRLEGAQSNALDEQKQPGFRPPFIETASSSMRFAEHTQQNDSQQFSPKQGSFEENPDLVPSSADSPALGTPVEGVNPNLAHSAKTSQHAEDLRQHLVVSNVSHTFHRAAQLVRSAVDVEGTIFFDARVGTYGGLVHSQHPGSGEQHSDSVLSGTDATGTESESQKSSSCEGNKRIDKPCKVLASSRAVSGAHSSNGWKDEPTKGTRVSEQLLQSLLRRYPHGKVWSFNEEGYTSSDEDILEACTGRRDCTCSARIHRSESTDVRKQRQRRARINDAREIQRLFPGVRALALVGMWDQSRGRWFSACAVWTYSPLRIFSVNSEVNYLAAFCDVIMAEVHRLEAMNSDRAKSDFISSISHELRSPLHGILGSVECLQDQPTDSFSAELVSQIDICGRTLLDIVDHLLDFSKISHFTKSESSQKSSRKTRRRVASDASQHSQLGGTMALDADVALDQITEEVVGTTVYSFCSSRDKKSILDRKVTVILDIDRAPSINWRCYVATGGWKRICINLISNALKYTDEGYVHISLKAGAIPGRRKRFNVILTVTDSGRGMSREFLENHLFKAFSQENTLAEGTGLGMSLVARIVKAMGGQIEVQSNKGLGTAMMVTLPMEHSGLSKDDLAQSPARKPRDGISVSILGFKDVRSGVAQDAHSAPHSWQTGRSLLFSSLQHICVGIGVDLQVADRPSEVTGDVLLIAQADLELLTNEAQASNTSSDRKTPTNVDLDKPLVILCDSSISARQLRESFTKSGSGSHIELVEQPCGPDRLVKAISKCVLSNDVSQSAAKIHRHGSSLVSQDTNPSSVAPDKPLQKSRGPELLHRPRMTMGSSSLIDDEARRSETRSAVPLILTASQLKSQGDNLTARSKSAYDQPVSPQAIAPAIPSGMKRHASGGLCLLLVDDNHINLQLLMTYARKHGHRQLVATDGQQAVDAYTAASLASLERKNHRVDDNEPSTEKPEVILMDINMPKRNGFEATQMIRAFEQQYGLQPAHIIALTGLGSASAQQEAYGSGVDLFLTKPVRLKELTKVLDGIRHTDAGSGASPEVS